MLELVLSLDPPSRDYDTVSLLRKVLPYCSVLKVGHILLSQWRAIYQQYVDSVPLFLDLKFLDIPNTVHTALQNYKRRFPSLSYYTIHGIAEDDLIKSCCDNVCATPISVISLSSNKSSQDSEAFIRLAMRNRKLGITHFVCPPNQVDPLRSELGLEVCLFVPGIRNPASPSNEHCSTMTAQEAKEKNVDYIIVGRPILRSSAVETTIKSYASC